MYSNFDNQNNTNSLSQNRAEEFGFDLFKDFVIPPIYEKIDFKKTSKSKIFIGGRGCGKTMLLRYLSHQTSFSEKKEHIARDTIENIGLYWKVDTLTVHQLQKRGMAEDIWQSAFEHLFTLILLKEFVESIESIAKSKFEEFSTETLKKIKLDSLHSFGIEFNGGLVEFKKFINFKRDEFQSWLRNVRKGIAPLFFPKSLIEALLNDLKDKIPFINKSRFNIYIDEYENLIEYQQKIVNTWVKHSENPIIFHLAMKRNAFKTKETVSSESLSNIHDYRIHDLEEGFKNKKEFRVFAAEIILYRLYSQGSLKGVEFNSKLLIEPNNYFLRKDKDYQSKILSIINEIFPSSTNRELANQILDDSLLYKRLIDRLNDALSKRKSDLPATDFIYFDDNRVSIVCTSLLRRDNIDPLSLKNEIVKLKRGENNKFFNKTEWIKNNFVGSYLLFYSSLPRACPLYTGFSTFCEMSNGNIRHLTELCYKTFLRASENTNNNSLNIWRININLRHQSLAAKQASSTFLNEIKTFGANGNQLHTFVMRLGNLFRFAHSNPKQSEPEQNHFSIARGEELSSIELYPLLNEALKWSVLFEHESTKKKSNIGPDLNEYVLNPIYAPYFHISYRKKRKLEFTTETLDVLINGNLNEYERLLKRYKEKWNLIEVIEVSNLFSDLDI